MKLSEKQLKNIISESINTFLKEYKSDNSFTDRAYTRPNGKTNVGTGLDWYGTQPGKRALSNKQSIDYSTGKEKLESDPFYSLWSHGKSKLCSDAINAVSKILQVSTLAIKPTGKIEWTDKELKLIEQIYRMFLDLASLSKKEGNEKRGYEPQQ